MHFKIVTASWLSYIAFCTCQLYPDCTVQFLLTEKGAAILLFKPVVTATGTLDIVGIYSVSSFHKERGWIVIMTKRLTTINDGLVKQIHIIIKFRWCWHSQLTVIIDTRIWFWSENATTLIAGSKSCFPEVGNRVSHFDTEFEIYAWTKAIPIISTMLMPMMTILGGSKYF